MIPHDYITEWRGQARDPSVASYKSACRKEPLVSQTARTIANGHCLTYGLELLGWRTRFGAPIQRFLAETSAHNSLSVCGAARRLS